MNFAHPALLATGLCAVPVLWLAWRSRAALPKSQQRWVGAVQALAILCMAVALASPWTTSSAGPVHRFVVWGGERTAAADAEIAALRAAVPWSEPFAVVRAGAAPVVGTPGAMALPAAPGTPDLTAALRAALAQVPSGARAAVCLVSDGRHDGEPLAAAAAELTACAVPVAVRELPLPALPPVRITGVEHRASVGRGEAFRILVTITAAQADSVRVVVRSGTAELAQKEVAVHLGTQIVALDAVLAQTGPAILDVELSAAPGAGAGPSPLPGGRERSAVWVEGDLRVLHLAADASRAQVLAAALEPQGIAVQAVTPDALHGSEFDSVAAVLVDDVPAAAWSVAHQQALADAVLRRGTGLLLAGVHHNLGPGGYATSPLAELLPARMPQREERRDPSVSLVLIVDTSGSMGSGRLELAKEVGRLALQKLQPHDKVGLIEFHGSKRWAAPLQPASNHIELTRALNRLQVGGGTIIYDALEEAHYGLLNAQTRFQHVLVLTDGGVESGPFEALARRMAAAGQTVSTVLIGPLANSPFLQNLAQWGRGRFYACPDKFQMPDLQFREPQSSLLPAVQERRLPLRRSRLAEATAAFAGDELPPSGGIVEASVRQGAEVLLRGHGSEPYLIGWDQGAGRVLVLAGQALGPLSGELHDDPAYGAFLADLLRSAAAGTAALSPELRVCTQERGARFRLRLPAGAWLPESPDLHLPTGQQVPMSDDGADWTAFVPFAALPWSHVPGPDLEVHSVAAFSGATVLARAAVRPPAPRHDRVVATPGALAALAQCTGGAHTATGPSVWPEPAPGALPQPVWLDSWFGGAGLLLFLGALLLRRLPLQAGRAAAASSVRTANRTAATQWLLWLGLGFGAALGAPSAARAQDVPNDPAAIRAQIDAELRARGDLTELAARWQAAPALARYWLARAQGDLASAAQLAADPAVAAHDPNAHWQLLDVLGQPAAALAALPPVASSAPPSERGQWHLRRAGLQFAAGQSAAGRSELEAAVAAAADPAFTQQAGVIAAAFGCFDLALQWHTVGNEPGRDAVQAALRRGRWRQRSGDEPGAAEEFRVAQQRAVTPRDRNFALALRLAVLRGAGALPAVADAWSARARGQGEPLGPGELQGLLEVLRELGRARDGLALLAALPAEQAAEFEGQVLALALDAGDPESAVVALQQRLQQRPRDAALRSALAVLLADLQRLPEAESLLAAGVPGATARELRRLCQTAGELGLDALVTTTGQALDALASTETPAEPGAAAPAPIEGALLEIAHLRRQGKETHALAKLLQLQKSVERPADQLRLAEQFESLGRTKEAIELYGRIHEAIGTEDVGMRLAWLLGESKVDADRQRALQIYRQVWTRAGSAARRVQAEEHVLDLAARDGTLADLALELEAQLAAPDTPNRPAVRDAVVKIYTRARDTTGAVAILQKWAAAEPAAAAEALQQTARVHLQAEEFRAHERTLQRLLELDPAGELDYRQQLAMSALERGRPEDARRHIQGLLGKPGVPDTVALEFGAGIYTLAALHEEAVRLYRRGLALHPERVETWLLLGNALRAAGQREAAIGTFQELLLRQLPDDLFVVAVDGLLNMEAPAPALAAAQRAVRLRLAARPEQVFLHRVLQDLHEAAGDETARLLALEDVLVAAGEQRASFVRELMQEAESRRDWRTYTAWGRTLLLLGDEVPPAVYLSLGEALLQTGDVDAAARAFARARLGPDFVAVEQRVAELYEGAGKLAEAERMRVRLLRRTPEDAGALLAVARLAERQGARARALPHWLAAAQKLLPDELAASRPAGRRPVLVTSTREQSGPSFAEPFAGALRCAEQPLELAPLRADLRTAAAQGSNERRLAALKLLRHLARAYPESDLGAELRVAEDVLLANGDAAVRSELRARRFAAGDLAGLAAIPAGAEPSAEELRAVLLTQDRERLAFAASKAKPALLPDLARALLLAGRNAEAQGLLPLAEREPGPRDEVRTLLGLPVAKDAQKAQQRLEQALARTGPLLARTTAVLAALRDLPDLPAGERAAHVQALAEAAATSKDVAVAERLLTGQRADLEPATVAALAELVVPAAERAYQLAQRAQYLDTLPAERAETLLRAALRKLKDEERRQALVQLFNQGSAPLALQLALVPDLDPRGVQGTDRILLGNGLGRSGPAPAVLEALAKRFAAVVPDDPMTLALQVRATADAEAARTLARAAVVRLATARLGERDDSLVAQVVRALTPADARELLGSTPETAPFALRIELMARAGDKAGAGAAYLAAYQKRPDDTALLYRAANFFESEGQFDQAAQLYRAAQQKSGTFYPYQAQQLARLELLAGNAKAALAALRAAKDPSQTNFRLLLRVLAQVDEAPLRRAALAEALQQRSQRGGSGLSFGVMRVLGGAVGSAAAGGPDRLAAVLQPPRRLSLAVLRLEDADDAPSDFDLLAFVPEGAELAVQLLRALDDGGRAAEPGLYRGWLGAAARFGDAGPLVAGAVQRLLQAPYDPEAQRVVLAAAQLGLAVPKEVLAATLQRAALEPKPAAPTLVALATLAAGVDPALGERLLRAVLQQRAVLTDAQVRPWLPGLFAMACEQLPELVLTLLRDPGLEEEAAAELLAAALLGHADPAAVAQAGAVRGAGGVPRAFRDATSTLAGVGAKLVVGDEAGARALLAAITFWPNPRLLGPQRLAAAVPPLDRWQKPEVVAAFADFLLAELRTAEDARAGALARLAAVLAARAVAAGRAELAERVRAALRQRETEGGLGWRAEDWLGG